MQQSYFPAFPLENAELFFGSFATVESVISKAVNSKSRSLVDHIMKILVSYV